MSKMNNNTCQQQSLITPPSVATIVEKESILKQSVLIVREIRRHLTNKDHRNCCCKRIMKNLTKV